MLGVPKQRSPRTGAGTILGSSPSSAVGKVASPQKPVKDTPTYTQEELDNDLIKRSLWLMVYERTVCLMAFCTMVGYLVWRWRSFVTKPSSYWISAPLILSETALIIPGFFITSFIIWHRIRRPMKRMADIPVDISEYPTVDIFIPCLNEPAEIVKATTEAACNIDYPKEKMTICICDDGNRAELKTMVADMQRIMTAKSSAVTLKYFARRKIPGQYHHAKAGNLNNAMFASKETNGQFMVVFDCDMVCKPEFLQSLIPHFYSKNEKGEYAVDRKIALVQSPQAFVGIPPHDPLGQQYRYFYGPVLQGWDGAGSTPCCGTNVIFSRECLGFIGGFVYGSVTEDFLTSMYLHNAGFNSKYVHEYLAFGLSPDSVHDFMKQRHRWAAGAVEIFFFHNAIWRRGLSWKQMYLYFWSGLQALLAFPLFLVCIVPFIALADHKIQVAPNAADDYLFYMGAFLTCQIWQLFISYRDVSKLYLMRSVQESVFMLFCKIEAVWQVMLKGKLQFVTTSKGGAADQSPLRKDIGHVIPHLIYYACAMVALGKVVYEATLPSATFETILASMVSLIWVAVVMWQCWPPIGLIIKGVFDRIQVAQEKPMAAGPATPKLPISP